MNFVWFQSPLSVVSVSAKSILVIDALKLKFSLLTISVINSNGVSLKGQGDVTTSFRFLHAADIHLDSPLKGLAGHEGYAAEKVRTATRKALHNLVSLAIEEMVDFLIIAGDLYDGDWRDYNTGLFFAGQMGRLNQKGIPVYLLHGNHDAESQITKRLDLPKNVSVFSARKPQTFKLNELDTALHGQSYRIRDVTENLVDNYPKPLPNTFNIGVLHTGLGGMGGHANYAPCSLSDLVNKGYDYWALGHVHKAEVLHKQPHVVFPGNLQGRHVRETGAKGACLITVEAHEIVDHATVSCDVVRWTVLRVTVDGADSIATVVDRVRNTLETAIADQSDGRLLACRIKLEGRTAIHNQLLASEDQILADIRASALGFGDEVAWIEKVVIDTEPEISPVGPDDELQKILQGVEGDEQLLDEMKKDIDQLVKKLPYEVSADIEDHVLKFAVDGNIESLIGEVRHYLLARLNVQES